MSLCVVITAGCVSDTIVPVNGDWLPPRPSVTARWNQYQKAYLINMGRKHSFLLKHEFFVHWSIWSLGCLASICHDFFYIKWMKTSKYTQFRLIFKNCFPFVDFSKIPETLALDKYVFTNINVYNISKIPFLIHI